MKYPRIKDVKPLPARQLLVKFVNEEVKVYDCTPLLEEHVFKPLNNEVLFKCVQVDEHGYGVAWNDAIDLSESELWLNGKPIDQGPQADVA